jgi:hypothetical protein
MNKEFGFTAEMYGFGAGIFFFGYFIFEVPSNLILERVGARRWFARIMISWGVIASSFAFVPSTAARREGEARDGMRSALIAALTQVYPKGAYNNPASWPRCALLTPHLLASCETENADLAAECAELLDRAASVGLR